MQSGVHKRSMIASLNDLDVFNLSNNDMALFFFFFFF